MEERKKEEKRKRRRQRGKHKCEIFAHTTTITITMTSPLPSLQQPPLDGGIFSREFLYIGREFPFARDGNAASKRRWPCGSEGASPTPAGAKILKEKEIEREGKRTRARASFSAAPANCIVNYSARGVSAGCISGV